MSWSSVVDAQELDSPERELTDRLKEILTDPVLSEAMVGVHVHSITDKKTLFSRNGTRLFNPASNVKLVTTAAALWFLGPNYKFKTTVYRDRTMKEGVIDGNLYFKGHGDPTLTNESVFGLVNEIALRGIKKVDGDIVVDDGFFDSVYEGPGWDQETSDQSYAPPVSGLSANYGTFRVRILPGHRVGAPAQVSVYPAVPSITVAHTVQTRGRGTQRRLWLGTSWEEDGKIALTVRGRLPINDFSGASFYKRVQHPTQYAGEVLAEFLRMRGIEITGKVVMGPVPKDRIIPVATHFSKSLASVVSTLNKYSNNFIAEQILKTMGAEIIGAPGTWEKGCEVVTRYLKEVGIAKDSFVLGNGSGLNDINRLTPIQVTQVLAAMYKRFELRAEFVSSLAVAGVSGTITRRFSDGPALSRLRAKTGSLSGVSALSGYVVTKDDKVLVFSVMMNDYPGRARAMWKVQDNIGNALADYESGHFAAHHKSR
jgi:serine-type D-Ala-D-Ala carboxypeptidase/endopeptidase (penicillin-binding protein 4)